MRLTKKLSLREKTKAAKVLADHIIKLWDFYVKKYNSSEVRIYIPLSHQNSDTPVTSISDILYPYLGTEPDQEDPIRNYWVATKYEITDLAWELFLEKKQIWVQSIPHCGIDIRNKPHYRESTRLIKNFRRMLNHAIELDSTAEHAPFLSETVRQQLRENRDFQKRAFFICMKLVKKAGLEFDQETIDLLQTINVKANKLLSIKFDNPV